MNVRSRRKKAKDWSRIRLAALGFFCVLVWLGLWARAYHVQIIQGPDLSRRADQQYWITISTYGQRGQITDSSGRLLAKSVRVSSIFARPEEVAHPQQTSRVLGRILGLDSGRILTSLQSDRSFVWIERKVSDKKSFQVQAAQLPGIYLTEEKDRYYPQGHLAGQLIGFVGLDNTGLEGLERSLDSILVGERSEFVAQRDASGQVLYAPGQLGSTLAGQDVRLTLDANLQFAAERALAEAVESNRAKSGMVLAVDVESGEILAWAHYPFFNPNLYRQSNANLWRNRIALDDFEPGSTLKPLLVAAALEEGVTSPRKIYFCENGEWKFQGHRFNDTHEYGWLSLRRVIRYSSNIGAGKIGLDLGAETYFSYLDRLGLGQETGLPLPGESTGILRRPGRWTDVDLVSASFGQGMSTTALQLARAYLCLASKGVLKPLKLIVSPAQDRHEPVRVFSPPTAERVLAMLEDVVQEDGTGTQARIEGLSVGGKTGTAQKASPEGGYGHAYLASFVGLFPAMNPDYLILGVVDEPKRNHYGGVVVAPAVREVALELVSNSEPEPPLQTVKSTRNSPDISADTARYRVRPTASPERAVASDDGLVPDLRGLPLRQALEVLVQRGVVPRVKGSGVTVTRQEPGPGRAWPESSSSKWMLWLGERQGRS